MDLERRTLKTAIDAKPDALPEFADDETWYRYVR